MYSSDLDKLDSLDDFVPARLKKIALEQYGVLPLLDILEEHWVDQDQGEYLTEKKAFLLDMAKFPDDESADFDFIYVWKLIAYALRMYYNPETLTPVRRHRDYTGRKHSFSDSPSWWIPYHADGDKTNRLIIPIWVKFYVSR